MDCSPPGSSVHGIFQARIQSGLPFPPARDLPDSGTEPTPPALAGRSCHHWATWDAPYFCIHVHNFKDDNFKGFSSVKLNYLCCTVKLLLLQNILDIKGKTLWLSLRCVEAALKYNVLTYITNIFLLFKKVYSFRPQAPHNYIRNFPFCLIKWQSKHIKIWPQGACYGNSLCYSSQKYAHLFMRNRIIFIGWFNIMFYIILQAIHDDKIWCVIQ